MITIKAKKSSQSSPIPGYSHLDHTQLALAATYVQTFTHARELIFVCSGFGVGCAEVQPLSPHASEHKVISMDTENSHNQIRSQTGRLVSRDIPYPAFTACEASAP